MTVKVHLAICIVSKLSKEDEHDVPKLECYPKS